MPKKKTSNWQEMEGPSEKFWASLFHLSVSDVNDEEFLREMGREILNQNCEGRLERAFRSLGGNLVAFLTTLDSVRDVLLQEGGAEEGFLCSGKVDVSDDCLEMLCSLSGTAAAQLLAGSLEAVAERFYDTQVSVVCREVDPSHYRWVFFVLSRFRRV